MLAVALAFGLGGCFGYRVGSSLPSNIRTVHIPPFINRSSEPQIEIETTRAAVQEFQKDGTLRIADAETADGILTVQLTQHTLEPLRYEKDHARTTSEYRLRISAHIIFRRRGVKEPMVDRYVAGETTFVPTGDLTSAKTSALPAAASDLAHQIVKNVVEYWE